MKKQVTHNSFYAYILILLSFFIILFFTRNIYDEIQVLLDNTQQTGIELSALETQHEQLTQLRKRFDNSEDEILEEIQWFTWEFSDKDILEYIHSYAEKTNAWNDKIVIRDIVLSENEVSDIGFRKAKITVSAVFSSETTLFNFMNYLTGGTGKYKFYINNFSYPMNKVGWSIQVSVPLNLYYK